MPDALAIQNWLVKHLAIELDVPAESIGLDDPMASLGLSSVSAVSLSGDLSEWLGRDLPPTLAYEYPTVAALVAHLAPSDTKASSRDSAPAGLSSAANKKERLQNDEHESDDRITDG